MKDVFKLPFPVFDLGNGFVLDVIKPETDTDEYFFYMNSVQVRPFISKGNLPESVHSAREDLRYWSSVFNIEKSIYWAIREISTQLLVGTIGFNNISFIHSKGEISYDLAFNYWGRGIVTKAINKIVEFGFAQIDLVRIQAYTARNNRKSMKLLERCKFKMEGVLRKFEVADSEHLDYIMYSIIR